MKTSKQFFEEHRGHELRRPRREFPATPSVSSEGWRPEKGKANCPKCVVEEEVLMSPDVICENHPRTAHISLTCRKCGIQHSTKNISYVGARSIFPVPADLFSGRECPHSISDLEHICEEV